MKVAALDLGTNTFLCLIAKKHDNKIVEVYEDLTSTVRLGKNIALRNEIESESLLRAESCLKTFSEAINKHQVEKIRAVATSAARDARNGSELITLCRKYNIPVDIISGDEEAAISFSGSVSDLMPDKMDSEQVLTVDIGGGSTELIVGEPSSKKIIFKKSLNIGAVRLTEQYFKTQPPSTKAQDQLNRHVNAEINETVKILKNHKFSAVISAAGTPTTLASLEFGGYDRDRIHGSRLGVDQIQKWTKKLAELSPEERDIKFNTGTRSDIILAGAMILENILQGVQKNETLVTIWGVRYGLALSM